MKKIVLLALGLVAVATTHAGSGRFCDTVYLAWFG